MSLPFDAHYSPPWVATRLSEEIPRGEGGTVFDPAVGEGALLRAASRRLGSSARLIGADIDSAAVRKLQATDPEWQIGRADATNSRSRASSQVWRFAKEHGVDFVVMNPPFSYRGGAGVDIKIASEWIRATPAVAFVAIALEELQPRSGLIAVLPRGALDGERDRAVWSKLLERYVLKVVDELPRGTFTSAAATSAVITLTARGAVSVASAPTIQSRREFLDCVCVEVVRGRVPVHTFASNAAVGLTPWLHTTDLDSGVARPRRSSLPRTLSTEGPFIVLPRVGRFDPRKIAVLDRPSAVVSDCLFALRRPHGDMGQLLDALAEHREKLGRLYFGTGAPHITLRRLMSFLTAIGFEPRHVSADSAVEACCCSGNRVSSEAQEA